MTLPIGSLTIAALAYREGEHLRRCFASLRDLIDQTGANTLVILDDGAADELTAKIAVEVAACVLRNSFVNFSQQRNFALDAIDTQWVFFIDPDERMTPKLAREIAHLIKSPDAAAYRVPRRNVLFGREVRHTGWYPDYQIRLLEVSKCRYDTSREVHELPEVEGSIGTLRHPLVHYNYSSWRQFLSKQLSYAPLEAKALYAAGHRARPRSFIGQPVREFNRRFVEHKGYKDGLLGLVLSIAMAAYRFLTYWHLFRLQRRAH